MKKTSRILAIVLALVMVLPLLYLPTFAADTEPAYGKLDADTFTVGATLTAADGFTLAPPFNKVVERDGRKVIRLPILCTDASNPKTTPTNRGQYFQIQHKAFSTTENTSVKVDLYMHGVSGNTPNIGIWLRKVGYKNASGTAAVQDWYRLGDINLLTGEFLLEKINGTKQSGATGLKKDAWNTVEFVFHPSNGSFDIYVNDALYAKCNAPVTGTEFSVAADMLMYAVCSSNGADAYTAAADAGENFANANYMDADNFIIDVSSKKSEGTTLEKGVHYDKDFEDLTVGTAPTLPTSKDALPNMGTIVEESGNKAWKIPFKGGATTADQVNINYNAYIDNPAISYTTSPNVIIEAKHYIPSNGIGMVHARLKTSYCTFINKDGTEIANQKIDWLNLWQFNYNSAGAQATLTAGGNNTGGSYNLPRDEWFMVSANIDMVNGTYTLYVNGAKAIESTLVPQYNNSGWIVGKGLKNLSIPANQVIVFTPHSSCKTTANDTYVLMDDIKIYDAGAIKITVDGKETEAYENVLHDLTKTGKRFVYADVEYADGKTERVTDPLVMAKTGMKVTTYQIGLTTQKDAQLRLVSPSGIRFLTAINSDDLAALRASEVVKEIKIGTLITLQSYLEEAEGKFDPAVLENYLDVEATLDAWYPDAPVADCNVFAGSVSDILEENYNAFFVGLGYAKITLQDGTVVMAYAANEATASASYTRLAKNLLTTGVALGKAEKAFVESVAAKYALTAREEQVLGLQGLNVLALGDSLFGGDYLQDHETWLALLAAECHWNMTNLGRDGWTVCYNPEAYDPGANVRNSIYKHLAEDANYKYGSTSYYNTGYATSKKAEDVDLIILEGGVNDYGWKLPLGTVNDKDGSTVLGAWMEIVDMLLVKYPNAKIMFLTSWYVEGTNAKGASRMDYVRNGLFDLVEKVYADEERVGILDGGNPKVTGVNMADAAFRAEYGKTGSPNDTNHLGAKGMKLMAEGMLPLIWDAMKEHVEEKGYTRVVCVGDSITRNGYWKNNLYGYLESDQYEVMGYGVNGATGYSKGIDQGSPKAYIDQPEYQQSLQYLPDVVVIMLGTNDTKPENYGPICADKGAQYIADIVALIRSYQSLPSNPKVYVALPATIFKDTAPIRNFPLEENLIAFLMEAAKQTGADVIDVHEATKDAGAHFSDKVHPSDDEGRKIIAQAVADAILEDE